MIDIKEIRENPEKFKKAAKDKGFNIDIEKLLEIDSRLKEAKQKLQDIFTEKNKFGKEIPKLPDAEKQKAIENLAQLKQQEQDYSETAKQLQPKFEDCMGKKVDNLIGFDWKSGKAKEKDKPDIYDEYKYQVAAYSKLYEEVEKKEVKGAGILALAKDKIAYNFYEMSKEEIDFYFNEIFLHALAICKAKKRKFVK